MNEINTAGIAEVELGNKQNMSGEEFPPPLSLNLGPPRNQEYKFCKICNCCRL